MSRIYYIVILAAEEAKERRRHQLCFNKFFLQWQRENRHKQGIVMCIKP
jgi:hypothetical protein